VYFRIPQKAVSQVRLGQAIELSLDAYPGERFRGEIIALNPRLDEVGRSQALRAQVALLEAKERQWEVDRVRQQAVIHGALERANAASNGYLEEVARLRAELHALRAQER
jgi:phage I-like protein